MTLDSQTAVLIAGLLAQSIVGCNDGGSSDHDAMSDEDMHADESGEAPIGPPTGSACPPGSALSYENFGKDFMESYCKRCHSSELMGLERNGASEGHDFDVLEGILPVAEHIDQYAAAGPDAVNTKMPPTAPRPTEEERYRLGEWLACELAALELDGVALEEI